MDTLSKAPLIEVIFELRWGPLPPAQGNEGLVPVEYPLEDTELFFGQFHGVMTRNGFASLERVNLLPGMSFAMLPQVVTHRYRKQPNTWPCYQVGLGIFTVNQLNEGYDWKKFKQAVLDGLGFLNEGHPKGLSGLPLMGFELRYQDGFTFQEKETAIDFLREKLEVKIDVPAKLTKADRVASVAEPRTLSLYMELKKPKAALVCNLGLGKIGGKRGYVMSTAVRSADEHKPERADVDAVAEWLEDAHYMQKLTFESLMKPAFAKSLK